MAPPKAPFTLYVEDRASRLWKANIKKCSDEKLTAGISKDLVLAFHDAIYEGACDFVAQHSLNIDIVNLKSHSVSDAYNLRASCPLYKVIERILHR